MNTEHENRIDVSDKSLHPSGDAVWQTLTNGIQHLTFALRSGEPPFDSGQGLHVQNQL
jgi:hypothetical protein